MAQMTCRIIGLVDGGSADEQVVEMACLLARQHAADLLFVTALVVERTQLLNAPLPEATAAADGVLDRARVLASHFGCASRTRLLRTRDVAAALVDEAADTGCDQLVIGFSGRTEGPSWATALQVLRNAPCPVWLHRRGP